jgi:molybdate transport system ATP-binding protein
MLSVACRYHHTDGFTLDVDMQLENGCTALIGPSGSGKTTLLSLIAGLLLPVDGSIVIDGMPVTDTKAGVQVPVHRRGIGMIMQTPLLFPHMTVCKNLEFGRRARTPGFRQVDFSQLIEVLQLGPLLSRMPATLSGGEKSRVAIGRALASRPRLLLMDEPLASLDDGIKQQILEYLKLVISQWQVPTVYVTHNRNEATRIADRVVEIAGGRLVSANRHDSEHRSD